MKAATRVSECHRILSPKVIKMPRPALAYLVLRFAWANKPAAPPQSLKDGVINTVAEANMQPFSPIEFPLRVSEFNKYFRNFSYFRLARGDQRPTISWENFPNS